MGQSEDGFPTRQLAILALCRFVEPIVFESIQSYAPMLVRDLFPRGADINVSFYAVLVGAIYAGAEGLTCVFWGSLSDRIGRKPVCLLGLAGVAMSCLLVGFAQSYWVALLGRFLGGALNGNVAVMKTMFMEIAHKPEHQPRAYSLLPLVWMLGTVFGAALGGYLARPAESYPGVFSRDGLFGRFPYLLPNLVCAVLTVVTILQGWWLLEESNPMITKRLEGQEAATREQANQDLLQSTCDDDYADEQTPLVSGDVCRSGAAQPSLLHGHSHGGDDDSDAEAEAEPLSIFSGLFLMPMIGATIKASIVISMYTILPVFLLDAPSDRKPDFAGGVGLSLNDVGNFLSLNGFSTILILAMVVPWFIQRVGTDRAFVTAVVAWPLPFLFPGLAHTMYTALWPSASASRGEFFFVFAGLQVPLLFNLVLNPMYMMYLKAACGTRTDVLGRVNGVTSMVMCLAKFTTPPCVGWIYGAFGSMSAWAALSLLAAANLVLILSLPRVQLEEGRGNGEEDEGRA